MKTATILIYGASILSLLAQALKPQVIERGPNHRVVAWETAEESSDGTPTVTKHSYVELANGMHYEENGEWKESVALIEPAPFGALARSGRHRVAFASDFHSLGAVVMDTPDGRQLRSHVLGIAYTDMASGNSVMIGTAKESIGEILPPNQIIYRDAFSDIPASVRYTYTRAGLEQDVLLSATPPSPATYGLNPDTTRLEVFTEFLNPPPVQKTARILRKELDAARRQAMVRPDLIDESLDFGVVKIGPGQAFPLEAARSRSNRVPVAKEFATIGDRVVLIEGVEFPQIAPLLKRLAKAGAPGQEQVAKVRRPRDGSRMLARHVPPPPAAASLTEKPMMLASRPLSGGAVVVDYVALTGDLTDYVFKSDQTYLLSDGISLWGQGNVLEGGTVIKLGRNAWSIAVYGDLKCQTSPYRPAIITAQDDASVGEDLSTGQLTGYYSTYGLQLYAPAYSLLHDVRFRFLDTAIVSDWGDFEAQNLVLDSCRLGFAQSWGTLAVRNALLSKVAYVASFAPDFNISLENVTIDQATALKDNVYPLFLTNCLLTAVSDTTGFSGESNVILPDSSGVFKTVGGGAYYLPENSPYRDAGTTNINPRMADELTRLTTYAPLPLGAVSLNTLLTPQAARDLTAPDLGYHYPPLDFIACGVTVNSNATLLATNGVAIGIDYSTNSFGFNLADGKFISVGDPLRPNQIVRAHIAQETSTGNPTLRAMFTDTNTPSTKTNILRARFTEFSQLANGGDVLYGGRKLGVLEFLHSRVSNPNLLVNMSGTNKTTVGVTNTLWERGLVQFGTATTGSGATVHLRNNLWRGVDLSFVAGNTNWTVRDELFDTLPRITDNASRIHNWTNAYFQTTYGLTNGVGIIQLASLSYESGPLGDYYQPSGSPLIGAGTRSASAAQLYHFTTTTNQLKEGSTAVDIGLHYLALTNQAGIWVPNDVDSDGVPDYLEDLNGNGLVESTESNWAVPAAKTGDTGNTLRLIIFTPIK